MTDIEMLPLYAELQGHPKLEIIKHYARAVAEHSVAARDAEIERLKVVAHGFVDEIAARDAEIEALRAALRHQRWCRPCGEDGWGSCEKGRAAIDLLRDYYQEPSHD